MQEQNLYKIKAKGGKEWLAVIRIDNDPFGKVILCKFPEHVGTTANINLYDNEKIEMYQAIALRMLW